VARKGEMCKAMQQTLGYTYLLTSDLLRNELKAGTELGLELTDMIKQGKITPQHKIVELIKNVMAGRSGVFLIDGFPKSAESLHMFNQHIVCERQIAIQAWVRRTRRRVRRHSQIRHRGCSLL